MDPHQGWNLVKLNKESTSLEIEGDSEDPELYIMEFEKINELYKNIRASPKKEDVDMIVQIVLVLPETYVNLITSRETIGIEDVTLEEVKTELGILGSMDQEEDQERNNKSSTFG
jgi:hypothetical protein